MNSINSKWFLCVYKIAQTNSFTVSLSSWLLNIPFNVLKKCGMALKVSTGNLAWNIENRKHACTKKRHNNSCHWNRKSMNFGTFLLYLNQIWVHASTKPKLNRMSSLNLYACYTCQLHCMAVTFSHFTPHFCYVRNLRNAQYLRSHLKWPAFDCVCSFELCMCVCGCVSVIVWVLTNP